MSTETTEATAPDEAVVMPMSDKVREVRDILNQHRYDCADLPLGGFGRGVEVAEKILADCPDWFSAWYDRKNWHTIFVCRGWCSFVLIAGEFGLTEQALIDELESA